jgi:uncharacterized repeat protein (TIGR04076 family)
MSSAAHKSKRYKVIARVHSIKGACPNGHKVGEEFIFDRKSPAGICLSALSSILPFVRVLEFGGSFPWEENPDEITVGCPDCEQQTAFRLIRVKGKDSQKKA